MEELFRNEVQLLIFTAKANLIKRHFDGHFSIEDVISRMIRIDTLEMMTHYCDYVEQMESGDI